MNRLDAMTAFVVVSELRSFSSAARRLGVSAAAVTRLIAALEEHLGILLLHRTTRTVTLTDAGARYLGRAQHILADLKEAEDAARAERSTPSGRLVIAAPSLFGRREVAPLMHAFLEKYSNVVGELLLADRLVNLIEEGVDAAVRIGVLLDSSLQVRRLGETRRVVVGAPSYFAKKKKPRTPQALSSHTMIQFTSLSPTPEWRFFNDGEEARISFVPTFVTNSADAAIGHAERGGGLVMVPAYQVVDAVKEGRLSIVLSKYEPPALPIQVVYPSTRLLSANVRAFIDLAVSTRNWSFTRL
jgi:DNA-binding transcriptional LysR family regulator